MGRRRPFGRVCGQGQGSCTLGHRGGVTLTGRHEKGTCVDSGLGDTTPVGRRRERTLLERSLQRARSAAGGSAKVLRGDTGIGKTALLDWTAARAGQSGFTVLRAGAGEAEVGIALGALHQVLGPLLGKTRALPQQQRAALERALGLRDGLPSGGFTVGASALALLAKETRRRRRAPGPGASGHARTRRCWTDRPTEIVQQYDDGPARRRIGEHGQGRARHREAHGGCALTQAQRAVQRVTLVRRERPGVVERTARAPGAARRTAGPTPPRRRSCAARAGPRAGPRPRPPSAARSSPMPGSPRSTTVVPVERMSASAEPMTAMCASRPVRAGTAPRSSGMPTAHMFPSAPPSPTTVAPMPFLRVGPLSRPDGELSGAVAGVSRRHRPEGGSPGEPMPCPCWRPLRRSSGLWSTLSRRAG
nr:BREX system ATP-binding domain-containing protein [Streptomyces sp. NRRL S-813]